MVYREGILHCMLKVLSVLLRIFRFILLNLLYTNVIRKHRFKNKRTWRHSKSLQYQQIFPYYRLASFHTLFEANCCKAHCVLTKYDHTSMILSTALTLIHDSSTQPWALGNGHVRPGGVIVRTASVIDEHWYYQVLLERDCKRVSWRTYSKCNHLQGITFTVIRPPRVVNSVERFDVVHGYSRSLKSESGQFRNYLKGYMQLNVRRKAQRNENNKQYWQNGINYWHWHAVTFLLGNMGNECVKLNSNEIYRLCKVYIYLLIFSFIF